MTANNIIVLLLIGLASGFLGGMVGVGGGIIIVPALIYFLGMSQQGAQGVSLGVIVLPVGFLAVYNYYKAGQLNFNYSLLIALGFVFGAYMGSKFSLSISQEVLRKIFAFILLAVSIKIFFDK